MKRRWNYDEVLTYQKENNQSWLYMNKDDKNIIVPRQDTMLPWTVNVANPVVWILLGVIILAVVSGIVVNIK